MSDFGSAHLAVLAAVLMTAVGQVFVKQASAAATTSAGIFKSWRLIVGYALLFGMTLMTQFALREMTLRELSLWITLTYPATIGLSAVWLRERLGRREALGVVILLVGLVVFVTAGDGS